MTKNEAIQSYLSLRDEIDNRCRELYKLHAPHLQCKAGCDMCCMDFSILPVEYHAIKELAGEDLKKGQHNLREGQCPFLIKHRCVIYHARPVICRTQGLPLLFMGEENWELSACELNFTDFDFGNFSEENTFPQDRYNSKLYMINKQFTENFPEKNYGPTDLLPISSLLKQ